jgi:hypothetical protein
MASAQRFKRDAVARARIEAVSRDVYRALSPKL